MPDFSALQGGPSETGSNAASSRGVTITASASPNTKGAWTQVIAATTHQANWLLVTAAGLDIGGFYVKLLIDIGVGAATSEQLLVSDLFIHSGYSFGYASLDSWLIPVSVPPGTRISARCQSSVGSQPLYLTATVVGGSLLATAPCGVVETAGVTLASTSGVLLSPGSVNTDSSWVEVAAATTYPWRWLCVSKGFEDAGSHGYGLLDIAVGASGSEQIVFSDLPHRKWAGDPAGALSLPCAIPAGSRVSARYRSDIGGSTGQLMVVLHGAS